VILILPTAISTYAQDEQVQEEEVVSFEPIITGNVFLFIMIKKLSISQTNHQSKRRFATTLIPSLSHPFHIWLLT
jgi:hypothetical protein